MFKLVVLISAVALASAKPSVLAPLAYSSVHTAPVTTVQQSSSVVHPSSTLIAVPADHSAATSIAAAAVVQAPLVLSPRSPALVLNAQGVPLATSDVIAPRYYQAKTLAGHGVHYLKKRSLVAPLTTDVSHQATVDVHSAPVVSYGDTSLAYTAPLVYSASLVRAAPLLHSAGLRTW